jgi:hypothetical protein
MMRNLKPFTPEDDSITVGWSDATLAQRAFWLNVSGAGKSRHLWKFLGLSQAQQEALAARYAPQITTQIAHEMAAELVKGPKQ